MSKLYEANDLIKLFTKLEGKFEDLKCFVKECCAKIPVNIGTGIGIFKRFNANKWEFKSLLPGNNILITETAKEIVISSTTEPIDCNDIKDCIGITPSGDANKYLNEQGDFLTITVPPAPTLQEVVNTGNGISNFGGIGTASIQSTNFTNNRTLYLNDNNYPTIRLVDNINASNYLQIDVDTLNLDGNSYNWSSIVNQGTVTNVTASLPLSSTSGNTPDISLSKADTTTDGYLSSTDWNTFNSKEPAITAGTTSQYWRGDKTWQTFPTIPTVGTWGALNYPTWTTGTPFVKMTASGTFSLDTNTYLTSAVTSVGMTVPSAFSVTPSSITSTGTFAITGAGLVSQYVRGDGTLANFPASTGGGASQLFYLNGSVSQGTFGGIAFKEMDKTPVLGAGTDFTINANGYIQSFITDANVPNLLNIPAGNWNFEMYFSASSGGGSPSFYVELYKLSAGTLTLIASNSANPEAITNGTTIDLYITSLAVPSTVLLAADRLAIRVYVTHSSKTITLHTEDNHLCQVITTFSTGITALNGLTDQVQNLSVGTSGTDFAISSATATHTFNLPTASASNRGALSSADWTTFNGKVSSVLAGTNISITGTATSPIVNKLNSERRNDWVAPYSYCGSAPNGSAESASVWTIYRIQVASNGTVTTLSATNVKWTDRLTVIYT